MRPPHDVLPGIVVARGAPLLLPRIWRLPALIGIFVAVALYLVAAKPPSSLSQEQAVAQVIQFVEKERGLTFATPPTIRFVSDAEFERSMAVLNPDVSVGTRFARTGEMMQAVGLLDPGTDLASELARLASSEAVGVYDIRTGELLVRGTTMTPYRRMVLAHELTHALDDQQFELHRPQVTAGFDGAGFAFTTLLEGNARRIENAYFAAMSPAERRSADRERAKLAGATDYSKVPRALVEITGAPYFDGPKLVKAILDKGGQAALDRAFVTPPTTAQHVLYPDLYVAGAATVPVADPTSPGPALVRGVFGAFFLRLALAADQADADWAARAWGGDRVVTWESRVGYCAAITFAVRDQRDFKRFAGILGQWAAQRPFGTVQSRSGTISVSSCSGDIRP